jgi:hypothetical protein
MPEYRETSPRILALETAYRSRNPREAAAQPARRRRIQGRLAALAAAARLHAHGLGRAGDKVTGAGQLLARGWLGFSIHDREATLALLAVMRVPNAPD